MQKLHSKEDSMHSLKNHIWDIYAALIVMAAALLVGGLQMALPYLT